MAKNNEKQINDLRAELTKERTLRTEANANAEAWMNKAKAHRAELAKLQTENAELRKPQEPNTFTTSVDQLDAMIEKVAAPLREEIQRLQQASAASGRAMTENDVKRIMNVVDVVEEFNAAYDNYMDIIRVGGYSKEYTLEAHDRYRAASKAVNALEQDPSLRGRVAEMIQRSGMVTREYGHRGVNAIATAMHYIVDKLADGIQFTSNVIRPEYIKPAKQDVVAVK